MGPRHSDFISLQKSYQAKERKINHPNNPIYINLLTIGLYDIICPMTNENLGPGDPRQRPAIRILNEGTYVPYVYPERIMTIYGPEALAQTESWVENTLAGQSTLFRFNRKGDTESKKLYLTWMTTRAAREKVLVDKLLDANQTPVNQLPNNSWQIQRNTGGMLTCQLASAANALNFLYPQNPEPYTESDILNALGGNQYAQANREGVESREVARALQILAPHIRTRRTNSVGEMLAATENGAAAIFPVSSSHEALIPPGHQIQRHAGTAYVQVADPMLSTPRHIPIDNLIKSEITTVEDPERVENNVLIIERRINEIRRPITSTRATGIQTIRPRITVINPGIRTLRP